ncbi:GNAT family N-acetyltransferase [Leptospira sp. 201903071]|uniref:arsenic resistance N-acetyltransferase ArsN2 n=1 Tax=Leptospira ainazelensis TaxID=2810034 RepID=UPI0019658B7E|nr:arsenic resistance N-acetyltransferase ArsN2 [Leptospira ainazelensis]MBM9501634.1 GNAT family N-acetyltransferase [Leptospira ainazelensis]
MPTLDFFFHPSFENVLNLLQDKGLPVEDLKNQDLNRFIGFGNESELKAVIGLELHGKFALLRSLAVVDGFQKKGLGTQLVRKIEDQARRLPIETLFLLTTTAKEFFLKLGYLETERDSLPEEIKRTEEFVSLCPASSSILKKKL